MNLELLKALSCEMYLLTPRGGEVLRRVERTVSAEAVRRAPVRKQSEWEQAQKMARLQQEILNHYLTGGA
jgi:hypothetical protein